MKSLPFHMPEACLCRPSDGVPPPLPRACSRRSDSRVWTKKKEKRGGGSLEKEKGFSHSRPSLPSFSSRTISLASQQERLTSRAITSEKSASRSTKGDVTQDDSQRRFLVQHGVAMLEQCCNYSEQCRNNVATLCWAKKRARLYGLLHPIKDSRLSHEFLQIFLKKLFNVIL